MNARADSPEPLLPIGTTSANSMESDIGYTLRVYFDNVTLTSQKPCQYNTSLIAVKQTITTFHKMLEMKQYYFWLCGLSCHFQKTMSHVDILAAVDTKASVPFRCLFIDYIITR